jgi:transcriptional regulator with XRE-family HTH domain
MGKRKNDSGISVTTRGQSESAGERLPRLRKAKGLTQGKLARMLGVSQPVVPDYERGELRLHGEVIVQLSSTLGVTADELLGLADMAKAPQSPWVRRLARKAREIEKLPRRDQETLMRTIDAYLSKAS